MRGPHQTQGQRGQCTAPHWNGDAGFKPGTSSVNPALFSLFGPLRRKPPPQLHSALCTTLASKHAKPACGVGGGAQPRGGGRCVGGPAHHPPPPATPVPRYLTPSRSRARASAPVVRHGPLLAFCPGCVPICSILPQPAPSFSSCEQLRRCGPPAQGPLSETALRAPTGRGEKTFSR